jgi:hypothetical protein
MSPKDLLQNIIFRFSLLDSPMNIQSPGSKQTTQWSCQEVSIEIKGIKFLANLIVLEAAKLDIILGMDWLTTNKGFIDCFNRVVTLTNHHGDTVKFRPKGNLSSRGKLNQVDAAELNKVLVVCEYPDVFPKELLGMPPDCGIEFIIKLA